MYLFATVFCSGANVQTMVLLSGTSIKGRYEARVTHGRILNGISLGTVFKCLQPGVTLGQILCFCKRHKAAS